MAMKNFQKKSNKPFFSLRIPARHYNLPPFTSFQCLQALQMQDFCKLYYRLSSAPEAYFYFWFCFAWELHIPAQLPVEDTQLLSSCLLFVVNY